MSDTTPTNTPPKALLTAVNRILRPLVRGFIHFGLTWPVLAELFKRTYVDIAREEFRLDQQKPSSDSRISLLTRVHRKDIRNFRLNQATPKPVLADLSVGAQIIARWQADRQYLDKNGQAKVLARTGKAGFEELARSVSKDTHPRAILDELQRGGAIRIDEQDNIHLDRSAFVPQADFDALAWYYGLNLHDHIAASTHNIAGKQPTFLDRSVHYSGLRKGSVQQLETLSRELAMQALLAVNKKAQELETRDADAPDADQRMTFGAYFYGETDE